MSAYQKWAGQGRAAGIPQSGSPQEHIYVAADAANADDNGPGTSAIPLATLNEAIQRVNLARITRPTIVHLATAPVNGEVAYAFTRQLGPIDLAAPLVFIGDGAGQPGDDGFTELLVDTVDAGASSTVVPVTGGGMGIDAFFGKTLELTSGTETGFRRTLNSNDATDLNLDAELANAPAQNDGLRIVEPAVRITVDQTFLGLTNARPTRSNIVGVGQGGGQLFGSGSGAQIVTSRAMLYFVNLALGGDTNLPSGLYELNVVDSAVCFLGCEWVGGDVVANQGGQIIADVKSLIVSGMDWFQGVASTLMPIETGLVPANADRRIWGGWSTFAIECPFFLFKSSNFAGFLHADDQVNIQTGRAVLKGGRISSAGRNDYALLVDREAIVYLEGFGLVPVVVDCDWESADAASLAVRGGAVVVLNFAHITKDNNGYAALAWSSDSSFGALPGMLSFSHNTTFEAIATSTQPDNAVRVSGGARAAFRANPTIIGAFAAECAVADDWNGAPLANASGSFAGLVADGDVYPLAAYAGIFGAAGFIQRQ